MMRSIMRRRCRRWIAGQARNDKGEPICVDSVELYSMDEVDSIVAELDSCSYNGYQQQKTWVKEQVAQSEFENLATYLANESLFKD